MSFESSEPCVCCGLISSGMVCYHHIYSRKAYPEFSHKNWNMISLCQTHHNEVHMKGMLHLSDKFYRVKEWLINNNWSIENGKWKNEFANS